VDEVVVNGDSGKRYVESLGFPSHRIFPIHQATDLSTFYVKRPEAMSRRLDRGLTKWRLIYSGRCIDLKGLQGFFEQLLTVAQADSGFQVNWTLCGEGPVAAELEERLRQEPESLRERVFLECLGSVAYSKLADVYAQADTLVLPTLSDEWGLVVNEALAMGIPVLGSRYSQAVMELIEPGKNGWIFDPLRAEDVREKIREAYHARGSIQFSSWENFEKTLQAWVKRLKLPEN
jgi:glycosyltransferase involved in cell wall biosynthesis